MTDHVAVGGRARHATQSGHDDDAGRCCDGRYSKTHASRTSVSTTKRGAHKLEIWLLAPLLKTTCERD